MSNTEAVEDNVVSIESNNENSWKYQYGELYRGLQGLGYSKEEAEKECKEKKKLSKTDGEMKWLTHRLQYKIADIMKYHPSFSKLSKEEQASLYHNQLGIDTVNFEFFIEKQYQRDHATGKYEYSYVVWGQERSDEEWLTKRVDGLRACSDEMWERCKGGF